MTASQNRDVVRRLAGEIAALARHPVQQERIRLWTALNDLKPERPMLWITELPWGDVSKAAENAGRTYVFSHKPSPAILAEDRFDAARAEKDLRDRLAQSGGMPCEFIIKDISTVRGDIDRVIAWCRMAHAVVQG